MRIALIRRVSITGFDGVNRFIALMAERFAKLGHEPVIISLCHDNIEEKELTRWFKEALKCDLERSELRLPMLIAHSSRRF